MAPHYNSYNKSPLEFTMPQFSLFNTLPTYKEWFYLGNNYLNIPKLSLEDPDLYQTDNQSNYELSDFEARLNLIPNQFSSNITNSLTNNPYPNLGQGLQNTSLAGLKSIDKFGAKVLKQKYTESIYGANLLASNVPEVRQAGYTVIDNNMSLYELLNPNISPNTESQVRLPKPDVNDLYALDIERLNSGSDFDLGTALNAVGKVSKAIPGKVGLISSTILGQTGTVVNAVKNLLTINTLSKAGVEGLGKAKGGNIAAIGGAIADIASSFMPEKTEYAGDKGEITQTMDAVYDGISDAAMAFGPVGMVVGGIMKGGKLAGLGVNALGGGTDGMTTADAILGSSFLNLTPVGLINGFGGQKTISMAKDQLAFDTVGSSYSGTGLEVDLALAKSGKKYGLFSLSAKNQANREIMEANRLQAIMSDIANESSNRFAIRNSMAAINGNKRALAMRGGYDLASVRAGRHGLSIQSILTAKRVVNALKFLSKPVEQPQLVDSFQQGGVLELSLQDIPEEYLEPVSTIEEVTLDSILPEFKDGGKVNVIPEGALHARLHHMENADNLTKKGIPVVSEKDGGELELLAEIEREEIIFRLEATKKLEELLKKYSDDETSLKDKDTVAIEAGKLLVEEILNNTIDNTNSLL